MQNVLAPHRGGTPQAKASYRLRGAQSLLLPHLCLLIYNFYEPLPCGSCLADSMPLRTPWLPTGITWGNTSIRVSLRAH